jgi:hypothetical protein
MRSPGPSSFETAALRPPQDDGDSFMRRLELRFMSIDEEVTALDLPDARNIEQMRAKAASRQPASEFR